jgi:hypothetical protein
MDCGTVVGIHSGANSVLPSLASHVLEKHSETVRQAGAASQRATQGELAGELGAALCDVLGITGHYNDVQWEQALSHYSKPPKDHFVDYPALGAPREPVEGVAVLEGWACPQHCCLSTSTKALQLRVHENELHLPGEGEGEGQSRSFACQI